MFKEHINIIIVESSSLLCEKIVFELSANDQIKIIGKAKNYDEFLKITKESIPCVVLMDIDLEDGKGIDLIKTIRTINKEIKIIIFTNLSGHSYREISLEMGVHSFFDKSEGFEQIVNQLVEIQAHY